jgi:hypothetical protein
VRKLKFPGKFSANFTITDTFDSNTITSYTVVAEGDDTVASTVDITSEIPPEGAPVPGIGVFKISYQFDAGWKYLRVYNNNGGPAIHLTSVTKISFWIYGDGSYNNLGIRVVDSIFQTFQPLGPYINWRVCEISVRK